MAAVPGAVFVALGAQCGLPERAALGGGVSERPIQVGDLVQVVRDCCGHWLGSVFTVGSFTNAVKVECNFCPPGYPTQTVVAIRSGRARMYCCPLPWLKRIPPLSELEGEKKDEQLKEPA
jgi:hypothetical protein